ncbi:MAG: Gfo/Idh/MocA family oxidoreductase [Bdellovibrionales bacterium]|nr:Gfo/Idh/MocA family oxidoreductase [Bdellovibrionales bacterium]
MSKLRAAVVGVGYLGRFHAQKYKLLPQVELVGVFDAHSDQAKKVAEELSVKTFSSIEEVAKEVDLVTVAATTSAHYELVKFFLTQGIHVNVEKPMTSTVEQAREICELARKNNLKLQVGHVERFNPALVAAQQKLERPLFIECHRLAPFKPRGIDVSVVLDLMIHDLDVVLSLVKSKVKAIHAIGANVLTKTADLANVRLEFESGAVVNITSSRVSQNAQRKFRVFQNNQYLSIDFGSGEVVLLTKVGEFSGSELPIEKETWSLDKGDALLAETESFVNSVINDTACVVTGEDGLAALELAEQIIAKIEN